MRRAIKRLVIAMLGLLVFLPGLTLQPAAYASPLIKLTYFNYTFEQDALDAKPGWPNYLVVDRLVEGMSIKVQDISQSAGAQGSKAANMRMKYNPAIPASSNVAFFKQAQATLSGTVILEQRFRLNDPAAGNTFQMKDAQSVPAFITFLRTRNGNMNFGDLSSLAQGQPLISLPYETGVWYTVRMEFNSVTNEADYFVNGELKAQGIQFKAAFDLTSGPLAEFRWFANYESTVPDVYASMDLDYVDVYAMVPAEPADPIDWPRPFLIVQETEYDSYRLRALQSPWMEMKQEAIQHANTLVSASPDPVARSLQIAHIASASSLAYILDPDNKLVYMSRVQQMIEDFDAHIYPLLDRLDHNRYVRPGSAFFNLVLAMDIMHDDFELQGDLAQLESKLEKTGEWYWHNDSAWKMATWGTRGIWALYKNQPFRITEAKQEYRSYLNKEVSPDGVFIGGPGYAHWRLAPDQVDRDNKAHFMDVLEYTGQDNTYYNDPRLQHFYEWLFGYSESPVKLMNEQNGVYRKQYFSFGDTAINFGISQNNKEAGTAYFRAHRFSEKAAQYASSAIGQDTIPAGRLLNYLLYEPLPEPVNPPSRTFADANAIMLEDTSSNYGLGASLFTPVPLNDNHGHKDVNSIYLTGYGEPLLRNVGYAGWGRGYEGFTWDYFHNTSESSNTVMIDGVNHVKKEGGGIAESIQMPLFGYAHGSSGEALPNGSHGRSLIQIDGQDHVHGYWIVMDQVKAAVAAAGHTANVVLHPNADLPPDVIAEEEEYRFRISPYSVTAEHPVYLSAFLATAPDHGVLVKEGPLCSMSTCSAGKYLYSGYDLGEAGERSLLTVLFPHDEARPKAEMQRIAGSHYSGASMQLGQGIIDYAFESSAAAEVTHAGVSFEAVGAIFRMIAGHGNRFYFAKDGSSFFTNTERTAGYSADEPITIYMREGKGQLVSGGTEVTFYYPGLTGVKLNGVGQQPVQQGQGWITLQIAAGSHAIELESVELQEQPANRPGYEDITVRLQGQRLQLEPAAERIGGSVLLPLRPLLQEMGAQVAWNASTGELTAQYEGSSMVFNVGQSTALVDGDPVVLDAPVELLHGEAAATLQAVTAAMDVTGDWLPSSRTISIKQRVSNQWQQLMVQHVTASVTPAPNVLPENVLDNDHDTKWAGQNNAWIQFDMGEEVILAGVELAFTVIRVEMFELQTSQDGVTWETVYSGQSSGRSRDFELFLFEPVAAKYLRFQGKQSMGSAWNSLDEVKLYGQPLPEEQEDD
ncbi:stalk domain-containing protein [Paenibacillus sp. 1P07SE]|uniref:stalk domain-containing protein n=1 Tax=Paenibacillus sp. 1P07SE TaxID=3132209 RepID=UPI0039A43AC7